jgi:threonyl-tRNA synthetase
MPNQQDDLEIIRHSLAHVMMQALKRLYAAVPGVGPAIENGFYHDFDCEKKISEEDLPVIEEEMRKIIKEDLRIERKALTVSEAIAMLEGMGYAYTAELARDLEAEGETEVSFYEQGDFINMCRGPHLESTGKLDPQAFKLTKVAGAYWKGDEKNKMIQRIYGAAFESADELDGHLKMLEEAEKRDHRKLGKELDLFVFSETIGKGLPLWTEKGATVRRILERFITDEEIRRGYKHVFTPDIAKIDLYKKSGHYPYYKDSMYAPITIDDEEFMLRPMTCPHHFELYLSRPRSYRELPMRIAELAKLYRYEQSGELSGLVRVRSFCLADAHIICADAAQAGDEAKRALDLIDYACGLFGLVMGKDYSYRLSLGDRSDETKYFKDDSSWDIAEEELRKVLKERKADFIEAEKEAAFYGPKIDIQMRDVRGKENTAFTVQYDFVMPKRFALNYIDQDGKEKESIVIHRSSIGAIERIMAFLIEHYAGAFPVWLAPVQVKAISVGEKHSAFARELADKLAAAGIRVEVDDSDETVGNKIRKAAGEKIPYTLVMGDKEIDSGKLSVRDRGSRDAREMSFNDLVGEIAEQSPDGK